jgi:ribonuclease VapC
MAGMPMKSWVMTGKDYRPMVIDTSVMIAILMGEPEAEVLARTLISEEKRLMSAFSVLEAGIVVETRKGEAGGRELDLLLHRAAVEIIPFTPEQQKIALSAWRKYGKGHHPAGLNIGDCCSYALARYTDQPLLYKGDDFLKTDIRPMVARQLKDTCDPPSVHEH